MRIRYDHRALECAAAFIYLHNSSAKHWSSSVEDCRRKIHETMIGSAQNSETLYVQTGGYTILYDRYENDGEDVVRCEILVDASVGFSPKFVDEELRIEQRVCWACGSTYTGSPNPSGKCPTCPDNDRPETPYELEAMATGQFAHEPYDVTCARCGTVLPCTEACAEEGDEWECQPCNERENARERRELGK